MLKEFFKTLYDAEGFSNSKRAAGSGRDRGGIVRLTVILSG